MSSFIPLPIRLAAPPPPPPPPLPPPQQPQQEEEQPQQQPQLQQPQQPQQSQQLLQHQQKPAAQPRQFDVDDCPEQLLPIEKEVTPTPSPPPRPLVGTEFARQQRDAISNVAQWVEQTSGSRPKEDHQFWLNDPKIVESLFTIHRSAKHLLDFTSTLIGSQDTTGLGQRPIPVMSNGDVLFMTQLSNDISHSAAGISAVRHHSARQAARKRARPAEVTWHREDEREHGAHAHAHVHAHVHAHSRSHAQGGASVKRVHARHTYSGGAPALLSPRTGAAPRAAGTTTTTTTTSTSTSTSTTTTAVAAWGSVDPVCWKCGRTETPEWRKGPDGGVLCNVCGLLYARQRRRMRSAQGASHASRSLHRQ